MSLAISSGISPSIFELQPVEAAKELLVKAAVPSNRLSVNEDLARSVKELELFVDSIICMLKDHSADQRAASVSWIRSLANEFRVNNLHQMNDYSRDKLDYFLFKHLSPQDPLYPSAATILWLGRNSPVGC